MKITTLIMLISVMTVSAATYAQKITLNEKNAKLEDVLKEIRLQSGYDFLYNENTLINARPVTVSMVNASVQDVLTEVLKGQSLIFEISDRSVVIRASAAPPVTVRPAAPVAKAGVNISGMVVDSLKKPIHGATVRLTPGKFLTASDKNGHFNFVNVPAGDYIITVTSVGYKTLQRELTISDLSTYSGLELILKNEVSSLNEITVNTGYQKIKPEQSTGATARIGTKEYESQVSTTFLDGIVNKLPGVLINKDVKFQGNSLFQIRGISTISTIDRPPLIVIDGYPTNLTLDMLDPNEIESVTVLKDAAAATVYGVRSSNGVIVVERKNAKVGMPQVTFRATMNITPKENHSRYKWDPDQNSAQIALEQQYVPLYTAFGYDKLLGVAPINLNPSILITMRQNAGKNTAAQDNQTVADLIAYNNTKDYDRLFLRNAVTQTYNVDVSGGNQNATYYFTGNYTGNTLTQRNNDNHQFQLSGRSTLRFSPKFSLQLQTDLLDQYSLASPVPDITSTYPYERFVNSAGLPAPLFIGSNIDPYYNQVIVSKGAPDDLYYPLVDMDLIHTTMHTTNTRVLANFTYQLGKGFNLNFGGVYESSQAFSKYLAPLGSSVANKMIDYYAVPNASGSLTYNVPLGDFLQQSNQQTSSYTGRIMLSYNKAIGKDHSINGILGTEINDNISQGNSASYFGYNDKNLLNSNVDLVTLTGPNWVGSNGIGYLGGGALSGGLFKQNYKDNRYLSGYANLVYAYRHRYSLSSSFRIDQSNLFGTNPKYRYKPLWSVGAGWNIDQEDFMKNVNWVKQLKLRVAYGFNGNVAKNALPQVIATAAYNPNFPVGSNVTMLSLTSPANSTLRWEQTRNLNGGIDGLLFNAVGFSLDFYDKKSTDLLAGTQTDGTKGLSNALVNTASLDNRGIELGLHADWIKRSHFNWNTGLAISYNKSKVLEVYNTSITSQSNNRAYITAASTAYLKGYPIGAVFGYRYAGIDGAGYALAYHPDGTKFRIGVDDENVQSANDIRYMGTSIPMYNAGLSNRVDIGRFYAYAMINYYGGFKVQAPTPVSAGTRWLPGATNYWKKPGDENIPGIMPGLTGSLYSTGYAASDKYIVNGDYFTLGAVTASYNFAGQGSFFQKAGFKQFEVKLQAANIYTVALNKYNYSLATGSFAKSYLTPTYTIALFTTF